LVSDYPKMPSYPVDAHTIKVPAGWLIEQAGWKGYRKSDAGVHTHQALVLVNYGNAKGQEIKELAEQIQESVYNKFKIRISPEVNFIN
jgi:UDP-N-acetylmuramate dehydrogenase